MNFFWIDLRFASDYDFIAIGDRYHFSTVVMKLKTFLQLIACQNSTGIKVIETITRK